MKRKFTIWSMLGLIAVLIVCWSASAQEKVHFDKVGRVNFTLKSVSAGVGYSWGEGHFIFKNKTYPIKVSGLSVITVGISSANIVGDVYNLKDPSDLAGKYTAYKAGAAVGAGLARATAKNDNGVIIEMVAESKGIKFDLGAGGFSIELK
jgi:hypothetical protein